MLRTPAAVIGILLLVFASSAALATPLPEDRRAGTPRLDRIRVPLADLGNLVAGGGESRVSPARFRQALHELGIASSPAHDLPSAASVREAARRVARGNEVPLAVLALPVRAGEGDSPVPLFAATALRTRTWRGGDVVFRLEPAAAVFRGARPRVLEFDPGDGAGYRPLETGTPIRVSYDAPGEKQLRFRAVWRDGVVSRVQAGLTVAALQIPSPDDTLQVTGSVPYDGGVASGEAYVYLAEGRTSLTDPIVVLEGFDLDNSLDWDELYGLLNDEGLIEDIRAAGYDAVVLNFDDATDVIQRNAILAAELLQQVRSLAGGASLGLTGASMGGLVGRYALLWMEDQGIDPGVRAFLTFDTPHGGANIPLGIQVWLEFFQGESADAAALLATLDRPASRQMLLYHHGQAAPGSDPLRAAFLAELAALGDQPAGPRLSAVANGSGTTQDQGFAAGAQIILYEYESFLVDITGNVWAVPDGGPAVIFDGRIDPILFPAATRTETVSGTLPWDNAPGGSRASMAQMDSVAAPSGDIVALHPSHCFVPTVSALGLPVGDPFLDVSGLADPAAGTGFDAVYFPVANQPHVDVTPENKGWILDELTAEPTAVATTGGGAAGLQLAPLAPNPVRGGTRIRLVLEAPRAVRLDILDVSGRRVARVFEGTLPAGEHAIRWEGRDDAGRKPAAGVYWLRAAAGGRSLVRSFVVLP